MDMGERQDVSGAHDGGVDSGKALSQLARLQLWLAGYGALEVIANRPNDHLLRDACLSREVARDSLRLWQAVGLLLLPRSGRE